MAAPPRTRPPPPWRELPPAAPPLALAGVDVGDVVDVVAVVAAVDVAVAHWVIPEERMDELRAYYTEQTDQVGGIMNDDNLPRTDATGRVTLPTRATCSAWVTEWERAGMVFVEAALEGEPTEHVLSLRAYPMIEVRIVEAEAPPV